MLHYVLPGQEVDRDRLGFSAVDIELPSSSANVAEVCLTARYPEKGWALNERSEMIVRILDGETVFANMEEAIELSAGATLLVEPNQQYYWKPKGFVRLLVFSTPPWTAEQHRNVLD